MNGQLSPSEESLSNAAKCQYRLARLRLENQSELSRACLCEPDIDAQICHCTPVSSPWLHTYPPRLIRSSREARLVAYVCGGKKGPDNTEQLELLHSYCRKHNCRIVETFSDSDGPSLGLAQALEALKDVDGLIAVDLDRFVEHPTDRLRDL